MLANPVPGTPAAVLSAVLRTDPANPPLPGDRHRATFSLVNVPGLSSLVNEVVWLPEYALLDANGEWTGMVVSQGWATKGITPVSAAYTPQPSDAVILCNATGGAFTVTLPDATQEGYSPGQRYLVKKTDSSGNAVTVAASAGQQIDGLSSVPLTTANSALSVVFDGVNTANWWNVNTGPGGAAPTGAASGDLSGTYPGPSVANTHWATQSVTGTTTLSATSAPVVLTDTTSGGFTVTLPTPSAGTLFLFVDKTGQWGTHNLTINRGGHLIDGQAAGLTLTNPYGKVWLYWDGSGSGSWWSLAAGASGETPVALGTASAGTHNSVSRSDHVHPTTGLPVIDTTTGDIAAAPGTAAAGSVGKAADAGHVHPQPAMFAPSGLTGAVQASRYAGATASGAPASGTFAAGDYVLDQSGAAWVCTAAGTPGTWVKLGSLDATATDIQPPGTQAAGSVGKAADAGHVHPVYGFYPSDFSQVAWTMDPGNSSSASGALATGWVLLSAFFLRKAATLTTVAYVVVTGGGTLTSTENFIAVFDSGGTQRAITADQTTAFGSTGLQTANFTSAYSAPAGKYYVAFLANGTTGPSLRTGLTSPALANAGQSGAGLRFAVGPSGQSTMPSSVTPSSFTTGGQITSFCAVIY